MIAALHFASNATFWLTGEVEIFKSKEMNKVLRPIAFFLIRELFLCCVRLRINWRKLLFAGAVMTVVAIVLHMRFLSQPVTTTLAIISQNSSIEVIQSMPVVGEITGITWMERRKIDNEFNVTASPPPRRTTPSRIQRYIWKLSPGEALLSAKKEIEHAPIITEDPDLYAPIFRNLSIFKRSYELMEMTLKVYIYREGKRPIFHHPHLKGIYASEGWFMKLMEGSREFVTRDPDQAHLFYLPYSVRQLEVALYKQDSHNLRPLSDFLRDYVNMIAAKYPYWNRTHGSDHFLVACHDWASCIMFGPLTFLCCKSISQGPYTTSAHQELKENTIKALCNADTSEGFFVVGKDVSLPETTIRTPKRPLRYIGGGIKVSQRPILAFFAGNMHGRVRPTLLKYWHDKDADMKIYRRLPTRVSQKMSYVQHMKSSKFCLCPMGYEVNSPRIVESIYYECVPVIIADNFVLPLSEVLDWSAFSVVVTEKDIPKLKEILSAIPLKRYLKMLFNVKMVQKHFFWHQTPVKYDLFHMILHSIWFNRLNQIQDTHS